MECAATSLPEPPSAASNADSSTPITRGQSRVVETRVDPWAPLTSWWVQSWPGWEDRGDSNCREAVYGAGGLARSRTGLFTA